MAGVPFPQRVIRMIGASDLADRVGDAQVAVYGPIVPWAGRSRLLRTPVLGHSVHPPMTDLTLGCWTSALLLDLAGGEAARPAAQKLVGVGVLAGAATALTGTADWASMTGEARRIGAVHALATDVAIFCFTGSWVARRRGRHATGVALALAGNAAGAAAGFLGGHLALARGTARREPQVP